MSSNSICNHTRDKQIGLPLRGRPFFVITRMISDRIGLHSVLLPFLIKSSQMIASEAGAGGGGGKKEREGGRGSACNKSPNWVNSAVASDR